MKIKWAKKPFYDIVSKIHELLMRVAPSTKRPEIKLKKKKKTET